MLPQHGGVPNFNLRISGPAKALLTIVIISGSLVTLSFYLNSYPGNIAAENRTKLSLIITILLTIFIFLASTGKWWHPHLWRHGNSQQQHRSRTSSRSRSKSRDGSRNRRRHHGSHHRRR